MNIIICDEDEDRYSRTLKILTMFIALKKNEQICQKKFSPLKKVHEHQYV